MTTTTATTQKQKRPPPLTHALLARPSPSPQQTNPTPKQPIRNAADLQRVFEQTQLSSVPYLDGPVVALLHRDVQRALESQWQMARLETARYDEALERYRANAYRLRRLILCGDARQRNQVALVALQQWADGLVSRFLDPKAGPEAWVAETLEPAAAFSGGAAALAAAMGQAGAGEAAAYEGGGKVSPLAAVMWHVTRLVNPGGGAGIVSAAHGGGEGGGDGLELVAGDARAAEALRQLLLAASGGDGGEGGGGGGGGNGSSSSSPSFPFSAAPPPAAARLVEVDVLAPREAAQLARYLALGEPLKWPRPAAPPTLRSALALATHRRLFGSVGLLCGLADAEEEEGGGGGQSDQEGEACGGEEGAEAAARAVGGLAAAAAASAAVERQQQQRQRQRQQRQPQQHPTFDADAVAAAAVRAGALAGQRPPLRGRYAPRLAVLRDYLGEALVHSLEARRACVRTLLVRGSAAAVAAGAADADDGGGDDFAPLEFDPSDPNGAGASAPPRRGQGLLDLDADLYVAAHEQQAMLEWLDALWGAFLEDAERLRRAVGVRAYASAQPLDEFRVESSRAFLSLLAAWRDAVVSRLMAPDAAIAAAAAYGVGEGGGLGALGAERGAAALFGALGGEGEGDEGWEEEGGGDGGVAGPAWDGASSSPSSLARGAAAGRLG